MEPRGWLPEQAAQSWEKGFMFLLSHIFQRGRSVKLSDTYYKYTVEALELDKNQDFDQFYEKFYGSTFERLFVQKLGRMRKAKFK